MSRATTLFAATDDELGKLFVAVRRTLGDPITKIGRNPLTGQVLASASWDPGSADEGSRISPVPGPGASAVSLYENDGSPAVAPALAPDSDAARALEEAAPPRLRALPHVATEGITGIELDALTTALLGENKPPARIVEALDEDGFVEALAAEAVAPLAELEDGALDEMVGRWAASMRIPGRRVDARSLTALRAVAREAIARGSEEGGDGHVLTFIAV